MNLSNTWKRMKKNSFLSYGLPFIVIIFSTIVTFTIFRLNQVDDTCETKIENDIDIESMRSLVCSLVIVSMILIIFALA